MPTQAQIIKGLEQAKAEPLGDAWGEPLWRLRLPGGAIEIHAKNEAEARAKAQTHLLTGKDDPAGNILTARTPAVDPHAVDAAEVPVLVAKASVQERGNQWRCDLPDLDITLDIEVEDKKQALAYAHDAVLEILGNRALRGATGLPHLGGGSD